MRNLSRCVRGVWLVLLAGLTGIGCGGGGSGAPDSGARDSGTQRTPNLDAGVGSNCIKECGALPEEAARTWCGTDGVQYAGCEWICAETPDGVSVWPGSCGTDGRPLAGGPPYPADGDLVCDWNRVGTEWIPVECAQDFVDIPTEAAALVGGQSFDHAGAAPASTPGDVDHRARYGPIKSQGSAGTCTAFATTAAMEGAVAVSSGQKIVLSEMHLWARYHTASTGAAAAAARIGGIASKDMAVAAGLAYDGPRATAWEKGTAAPDAATVADLDALGLFEVTSVDKLDPPSGQTVPTIEQLRLAIENGSDILIGMFTSCTWQNPPGGVIADYDMSGRGGHAVLLVGYRTIDNRLYFTIRNSWGAGWADSGYAYISADALHDNIKYGWTISARPPNAPATSIDCPTGQSAALDGTCRTICSDGALADPVGTCASMPANCIAGQVPDATGVCVTGCKPGTETTADFAVTCSLEGCAWSINSGVSGCTNGPCDKFCPAPICDITTTVNELNQTLWTCTTGNN